MTSRLESETTIINRRMRTGTKSKPFETKIRYGIPLPVCGTWLRGVSPKLIFFKGERIALIIVGVKVEFWIFQTICQDVYRFGDCVWIWQSLALLIVGQLTSLVITGRMHGETLSALLAGRPHALYKPGIWFSTLAKFLDIRIQTYGTVAASWDSMGSQLTPF